MKYRCLVILWVTLSVVRTWITPPAMWAAPPPNAEQPAFAPGELIVLLAHGGGAPTVDEVVESHRRGREVLAGLGGLRPKSVKPALVHRAWGKDHEEIETDPESARARLEHYLLLGFPETADLDAIQVVLERNPYILHVERNHLFRIHVSPMDPLFPVPPCQVSPCFEEPADYQWGLHALNLPAAWDLAKGHGYVGLIDTGLQVNHPDLRAFNGSTYEGGNFRPHFSWDFSNRASCSTNQGQCVDEMEEGGLSCDGVDGVCAGHGTHVAGIVAATTSNMVPGTSQGIGVAGTCWNCSVMMTRGTRFTATRQSSAEVANGLTWLVDHGVQAISMSFGDNPFTCSPPSVNLGFLCTALAHAEELDVVMTASAGNDKLDIDFPASDPRVLSIGGIEPTLQIWDRADEGGCPCAISQEVRDLYGCNASSTLECGSNYTVTPGSAMQDLVAPAKQVLSTFYENREWTMPLGCHDKTVQGVNHAGVGYDLCTGTSMSSPHVAGLAGILRSVNPLLSKAQIAGLLTSNASRAGSWDPRLGYGVPNAAESVRDTLGRSGGAVVVNRLTPLFSLYSDTAFDHFYTTVPQMASAAIRGTLQRACFDVGDGTCADPLIGYQSVGPGVPRYSVFPGTTAIPAASVYIFTTDRSPNGMPLVPLYRMSFSGPGGENPSVHNRDTTYTTEPAGVEVFHNIIPAGYRLDGIEGYIYKKCTPEPSCMPVGTVRLLRRYHAQRDDFAIFPESELAAMESQGYTSIGGNLSGVLGYVYPNADFDGDTLIDGSEWLTGTSIAAADSDCDGASDGAEVLNYPYGDPLGTPGCVPKNSQFLSQSVPSTMTAGQSYAVSMTVKNVGTLSWSPIGPQCTAYRLGAINPYGNITWGRVRVELPAAVAPGGQTTLNYTVTAPTTPGTYNFQWRMVHECVEWFGSDSPNVAVNVVAPPPPVAGFNFTCSALSCSFNGAGSTGTSLTYAWSFGDATSGTGSTASRLYGATGSYVATLTVTDPWGRQSSKSKKVSVTDEGAHPAQSYFTVAPCRLLDTRSSTVLNSGQLYVFNVAGSCGIPATAKAVSFNIGVVSASGPGYLIFYPGDRSSGPFVNSTITFHADPTPRFNNAILRLATNGAGTLALWPAVFATPGQFHLILDIYGYFSEDASPAPGAQGPFGFQSVTPCRIADTRNAATPLAHDVPRSFAVQGACGVPVGAAAAVLNPVAVGPSEAGYIQVFQAGTPLPQMAALRFPSGVLTQANGARVRLSASTPDVTVQFSGTASTTGTTHFVLDGYGYFKSDAPLKYHPLTSCRLVDTRFADHGAPALAAGETRTIQVQGNCGVPVGAKAAVLNLVAVGPAANGHLIGYPSGTSRPLASILNFHPSQGNLSNGAILPLSTNADDLAVESVGGGTHLVIDVFGFFQ